MLYAKQVHMQYPDKHGNYDIETEPKDSGRSQANLDNLREKIGSCDLIRKFSQ